MQEFDETSSGRSLSNRLGQVFTHTTVSNGMPESTTACTTSTPEQT